MKKINSSYLFIGVLVLLSLSYRFFFKSKPKEIPKYGNYLSCIGTPFDLKVKLKSEIYLLEKAMPEDQGELNRLMYAAVYYQNLFSFTNILDNNPNTNMKWSSVSDKDPVIKILGSEPAVYPYEVDFADDEIELKGFPPAPTKYLTKVISYKKIHKGEPARKITYEYENDLLTCFTDPTPASISSMKFHQPMDPYTAYFAVPKSHRVLLKNPVRFAEGIYNPCMNPDGISAIGFNPFGYWYFWRPEAKGHSADKVPFDCTLFYQEGKNYQLPKVSYTENSPKDSKYLNFAHFEKINRPIKMTMLVGGQESKIFQKLEKADVEKFVDLYLSGIDASTARKQLPAKYDAHFAKILLLLWKVKGHMEIYSKTVTSDELSVNLILRGKLKLSKKDIELKISLSPNNPDYEGADIFAKNFNNEFMNHDIVVYEGHASTGNVFNEGLKLLKEQNLANQDKSIAYQIFAIYSCSSSYYYHPESFPRIENPGFKRDIVRTAGAYLDGTGNGSLALIASLDQYLYNESYVPFAYWAKNFKSDNFYILSNH